MKKILILLLVFGSTSFIVMADANYDDPSENLGMPSEICTITSEPCSIGSKQSAIKGGQGQMARYQCCVSAESGFVDLIASIYKYVFFISLVLGVLLMVALGIGISVSGFGEGQIKAKAKTQLIATVIGIIALALIPWLLKTIAPFIFT